MKKSLLTILASLFAVALLVSCQSIPENVPDDITEAEIIQNAQECFDLGNNKGAIFYYELLINRYGEDIRNIIVAKYEIAHIYIKSEKWDEAEVLIDEALAFYDDNPETDDGTTVLLPPEYKKLLDHDKARVLENKDK